MKRILWFPLLEGCLYLAFLSLDLFLPGSGWDISLKYLSILLCFCFVLGNGEGRDSLLMKTALGFTLLADLFLLVLDHWYLIGVACFCVVQLLYLTRIAKLRPEKLPLRLALRGLLVVAALITAWRLGALDGLTALSLFYFSQLICNALESLSLGIPFRGFSLGLFLFVGCDLCVGLQNLSAWFPAAGGPLVEFARVGMWLFYLPSQVLISLSVKRK